MYWLCFYNGLDMPCIEAAFKYAYMLIEYAEILQQVERLKSYSVFTPFGEVVSCLDFMRTYKEVN